MSPDSPAPHTPAQDGRAFPSDKLATPDDWARMLDRTPVLRVEAGLRSRVAIRRWQGTHPDVLQPPLDQHYVVLHLGGPKRVSRRGGGGERIAAMDPGDLTIVGAGAGYRWRTEGAIDYAHIYIPPERLALAAAGLFGRVPGDIRLVEGIGVRDRLLSQLFEALLQEAVRNTDSFYVDTLHEAFLGRLLAQHSNLAHVPRTSTSMRTAIAPHRLSAVLDYVEAHLDSVIGLEDLAGVAGLSAFHFARAFALTTGSPPYAYVMLRRLEAAKRLLRETSLPVAVIAARCGFASASHFAGRFRQATGLTPTAYRRS